VTENGHVELWSQVTNAGSFNILQQSTHRFKFNLEAQRSKISITATNELNDHPSLVHPECLLIPLPFGIADSLGSGLAAFLPSPYTVHGLHRPWPTPNAMAPLLHYLSGSFPASFKPRLAVHSLSLRLHSTSNLVLLWAHKGSSLSISRLIHLHRFSFWKCGSSFTAGSVCTSVYVCVLIVCTLIARLTLDFRYSKL
jgi:hypothetical protein